MLREERMDILLNAVYKKEILNTYDFCAGQWKNGEEEFQECKALTDELVEEKLVRYNDEQKTEIKITNYGRYWVVQGGFLIDHERKTPLILITCLERRSLKYLQDRLRAVNCPLPD